MRAVDGGHPAVADLFEHLVLRERRARAREGRRPPPRALPFALSFRSPAVFSGGFKRASLRALRGKTRKALSFGHIGRAEREARARRRPGRDRSRRPPPRTASPSESAGTRSPPSRAPLVLAPALVRERANERAEAAAEERDLAARERPASGSGSARAPRPCASPSALPSNVSRSVSTKRRCSSAASHAGPFTARFERPARRLDPAVRGVRGRGHERRHRLGVHDPLDRRLPRPEDALHVPRDEQLAHPSPRESGGMRRHHDDERRRGEVPGSRHAICSDEERTERR
jgi:hypothetical protein